VVIVKRRVRSRCWRDKLGEMSRESFQPLREAARVDETEG
jgi:hypothetical protein